MKRLVFFSALLITFAFLIFEKSYAIDPNCLKMVMENTPYESENLDSIMVDICQNSPTYGQWYVKKGILIRFYEYPFVEDPIPVNAIKYWYDIDTNLPLLREKLQYISNNYGNFTIVRENEDEESHHLRNDFTLTFENYVCFDSLCNYIIDSSANVKAIDLRYIPQVISVEENTNNPLMIIDGNILKINLSIGNNSEFRLIDIYGNKYNADYEITENSLIVNIENLSVGVYFIQIDNSKPIKFVKY